MRWRTRSTTGSSTSATRRAGTGRLTDRVAVRLGAHESVAGGVSLAFGRAAAHGARSVQIFTRSARGWSSPPLAAEERRAFRRAARAAGVPAIADGSYLVNLASEDPVVRARSLEAVRD